MQSVIGCYQEEGSQDNGEYIEELENIPGVSPSTKTEVKDDVKTGTLQSNVRSNMFRDMESGEVNQDNHLSILTAHLNLGTNTIREIDHPIQMTESSSGIARSSQCLEDMAQLRQIYQEAFGPEPEIKPASSPDSDAMTS